MPGISVTTGVRVGPTGADSAPSSTLFIAGTAERGPIDKARLITGMSQFEAVYGEFSSSFTLHDNVKTFFEEGGTRCYVARTTGTGAHVAATVPVPDSAASAVLTLTAKNPGLWANTAAGKEGLKATVSVATGAVSIEIFYKGASIFTAGGFTNETLPDGSTKYAKQFLAEAINTSTILAELVTATAGPSLLAPVAATYNLVGGTDASSSATAANVVTAFTLFDYDLGAGAVAAPGFSGTAMWNGLRDHAKAHRRIALCGFAVGTTSADAIAAADDYWGTSAASRTDGSYMAFYWPSIKVPDGFGGSRDQTPEAYVAAARARAHQATGSWRAGAGDISTARYVSGLHTEVTRATGDLLDANRINALRVISGSVRVYGARSISADDTNWRFITYRDTLNYITAQAEQALEPLVFRPVDGRGGLFGQVEATLTALMEPLRLGGGVFEGFNPTTGRPVDPGYSVDVSAASNPLPNLANGEVTAVIGARVSPVADKYDLTITKSTLTATV